MEIVRCPSCEGYGWFEDEFTGEIADCDWCDGTGYVYRDAAGVDHRIPERDYGKVADQLERLDQDRLRGMGYTGGAVHPRDQAVRGGRPDGEDGDHETEEGE